MHLYRRVHVILGASLIIHQRGRFCIHGRSLGRDLGDANCYRSTRKYWVIADSPKACGFLYSGALHFLPRYNEMDSNASSSANLTAF